MKGLYLRRRKWWLRFTHEGRQRFVSTGCADESMAILQARKILANPAEYLDDCREVDSLLERYHSEKAKRGVSNRWRDDERYALGQFFRVAQVRRVSDISTAKVAAWLADKGPRTSEQYLAIASRFCRWLVATGRLPLNPCDEIPRLKMRPRARRRFLSRDECDRLLAAIECPNLRAAVMLALHAGLRKGEVLAARWSWVDLSAGLLHVQTDAEWTPKDRCDRTIPISGPLARFLQDSSPFPADPRRFIVRPEKGFQDWRNRWEFRKPFERALTAAGIEGATFHDLRRTFASLLASNGVSLYKIAQWLGDGHAVVERHYAHLQAQDSDINRAWS